MFLRDVPLRNTLLRDALLRDALLRDVPPRDTLLRDVLLRDVPLRDTRFGNAFFGNALLRHTQHLASRMLNIQHATLTSSALSPRSPDPVHLWRNQWHCSLWYEPKAGSLNLRDGARGTWR